MSKRFDGFPKHNGKPVPLPASFFSDLLPLIDDLDELKLTLFCFRALYQKEGQYRYLRYHDFTDDEYLMKSLSGKDAEATLNHALALACERGTILATDVTINGAQDRLYFLNTELGRRAVAQINAGAWKASESQSEIEILPERPTIYRLYEDNIGPLTPMIAETLKDAEREYPTHWIEEAIQTAVENNARKWRYILKVLERWRAEGRSREITERHYQEPDGRRYVTGKYADIIEH